MLRPRGKGGGRVTVKYSIDPWYLLHGSIPISSLGSGSHSGWESSQHLPSLHPLQPVQDPPDYQEVPVVTNIYII